MARCKTKRTDFKAQARVLKALANESRLMIVDALGGGERTAGQLTWLVGLEQSTVSKHLAVLRSTGIVDCRRYGSSMIYELVTPCALNFFRCAGEVLEERS